MGCLKINHKYSTDLKASWINKSVRYKKSENKERSSHPFGFNGKENDNEVKGAGNSVDFGARIYDSRLSRWLSVDPLQQKYPFASPYNFVLNNPINAIDPDGKDVVFINGFSYHDTDNKFRGGAVSSWRKNNYWNKNNPDFTGRVGKYFNDSKHHFLSASQMYGSKAKNRQRDGYNTALQMVKSGEIILSADNPITVVMHSQGNAFGAGYMQGILDAGKAAGIDVKVNGVMLSTHQGKDINTKNIADKSIQFTYGNDNAGIVSPMDKVPGVPDANAGNKNNVKGGLDAHSATVDNNEAFDAIKKVDTEKKVYKKR